MVQERESGGVGEGNGEGEGGQEGRGRRDGGPTLIHH